MPEQKSLFDTQPPQWQLDDQNDWLAARIVFAEAPYGPYDYSIPAEIENEVVPGVRVQVPLGRGNRKVMAYCVDVIGPAHPLAATVNPRRLKPIQHVIDKRPIINKKLLGLANWISEYYLCPLGTVIETVVPPAVRDGSGTREMTFLRLADGLAEQLEDMKLTEKQRAILKTLAENQNYDWTTRELAETVGCTAGPITNLRKKGMIESSTRRVRNSTHQMPQLKREDDHRLNTEQQAALDRIVQTVEASEHETYLTHGITGSGKTEVYIRAIQKVVEFGKQAIVLVPEISLTPQTRQRFRARFDRVAVLHSHLTPPERSWHWQQIADGNVDVVIGARSAIFAPTPRLGLIVLDEEHDSSFKQDKAPRYHARDVAQWRGEAEKVPLVLGSATPSLECWQRAVDGKYQLLSLPNRVLDLPLPDVATVDLRVDFASSKSRGPISQKLRQEIGLALNEGGQVILLLNRRGFSTRIQCPGCGNVEQCPDCSIPLTHHRDGNKTVCHYCDHQAPEPDRCSECGFAAIKFSGIGTQRLEREVQRLFPEVPIMRMDTDTMRKPGSHEKALASFRAGETKILLGTQMIAKGLDFPNVTLVGVINADTALHFPDFRASERTFGLVTQVAGRSGRSAKGGRVLVQTFSPEHMAIVAATKHDYVGFAEKELPMRQDFGNPPFARLARVVVRSESQIKAGQFISNIADQIQLAADQLKHTIELQGPGIAPIEKLRGRYRFHLLIIAPGDDILQPILNRAKLQIKNVDGVQWIIDIDPQDML